MASMARSIGGYIVDKKPYQHTDEIIGKALQGALNARYPSPFPYVDKNLVDAFTYRLMEAGVELRDLDELFADADASKIDAE